MFNFFMCFGYLAPVQTGYMVMDCVVAIIKKEEIQKAGKIPGMIPLGLFISVNVLDIIKNQNAEERYLLRYDNKKQCFIPIQY